ncbi:MAG: DUF4124 domain-containing protein [Lautropia sp.]
MAAGALAVVLAGWAPSAASQGQIFRCESEQGGPPVYQNTPGRNCKALDLPPLTTVPAPRQPAARAPAASQSASAGNFPRVGSSEQRQRDSDRRRILEDELSREQGKLTQLRKEYNGGEPERLGDERNYQKYLDRVERLKQDVQRSESNVASLQRELEGAR